MSETFIPLLSKLFVKHTLSYFELFKEIKEIFTLPKLPLLIVHILNYDIGLHFWFDITDKVNRFLSCS